eukprot:3216706-Rhodomonas_salina.1
MSRADTIPLFLQPQTLLAPERKLLLHLVDVLPSSLVHMGTPRWILSVSCYTDRVVASQNIASGPRAIESVKLSY